MAGLGVRVFGLGGLVARLGWSAVWRRLSFGSEAQSLAFAGGRNLINCSLQGAIPDFTVNLLPLYTNLNHTTKQCAFISLHLLLPQSKRTTLAALQWSISCFTHACNLSMTTIILSLYKP